MKTLSLTILLLTATLTLAAQKIVERNKNYWPDGNELVCVNGQNRFTRALYGGHTAFRIETSDRPVFASYLRKNANYSIRFSLTINGTTVPLDSTDYCEARYEGGRRTYILRDKRFLGGTLHLAVLADADREGGLWQFAGQDFSAPFTITGTRVEARVQAFRRGGDMVWAERKDGFEPALHPTQVSTTTVKATNGRPVYIGFEETEFSPADAKALSERWTRAENYRRELTSMVTFSTPDAFINPLGGVMMHAADGAWDGTTNTWLHGAVGWRMTLPGWRAAYMGDFLGFPERQRQHFEGYAASQVTDVPVTQPHLPDSANNLARGAYVWGTPMYSDGYICRSPRKNHTFHHYDMNLNFIDELLWHFQFDADTAFMRRMWPVVERHLAWEKQAWDPDGDHLYDAYCCIWASDALQYNSGAVTHASAYNYRGNRLAARMARLLGLDATPYEREADAILQAMNSRLWLDAAGHWAEFQDFMGNQLVHDAAALWSIYTPIDEGACTPEQAYRATCYVDSMIPHIPFVYDGQRFATVSTSSWAPYEWSINNVAMAEVFHMALAYFEAGRPEAGFRLLKSNIVDLMYAGRSPGNFAQLSALDRNTGEGYRDFSDVTGIGSRALVQGLFGITPQALDGKCIVRPGFPASWDSASIHTPYLDYRFERRGGKDVYTFRQRFASPLKLVLRQNIGQGRYVDIEGTTDSVQVISVDTRVLPAEPQVEDRPALRAEGTAFDDVRTDACRTVDMKGAFNAHVTDIFRNEYLSPRSPYTTLALPKQGIGDWCSTKRTADIDDTALRQSAGQGPVVLAGVPFATPAEGPNIAFTSLWDNYPDSISIKLSGRAAHAYLLMAGSTNPMQSRFVNGVVRVCYADGSSEVLNLSNPDNWCPIEQDFDDDGRAFSLASPRPLRVSLKTLRVSRTLALDMHPGTTPGRSSDLPSDKKPALVIEGGAAQLIDVPLNPKKKLKRLTLTTRANDVVMGLMGVTLQK